jgi:short-subunit dehydrogenase
MNAIITGATKGIGKAIAIELAKAGYNIVAGARDEKDLSLLKEILENNGVEVLTFQVNMSKKAEVSHFFDAAVKAVGSFDVLVNNVGVFLPGNLLEEDDEVFEMQQAINTNAAYYLSKSVGKLMVHQRKGHIFNICSVASKAPVDDAGSYSVTKAAMLSLNHVLRKELAPHQIKVTAFVPGSTYTSSWEGTSLEKSKFVQPEDIAKLVNVILQLSAGANVDEIEISPLNF